LEAVMQIIHRLYLDDTIMCRVWGDHFTAAKARSRR
jgi:hypothetical protein